MCVIVYDFEPLGEASAGLDRGFRVLCRETRGFADRKEMVSGLNHLPEHVLGKKTKNMGPTGAHLGQRHTLTSVGNDFRQFFSTLILSP